MRFLILSMLLVAFAWSRTPEEQAAWFAERWALIEEARRNPSDEIINRLGMIVLSNGRDLEQRSKETQELWRAAQAALLAIPGHAEYYRDRLNEMYDKAKEDAERYDRSDFDPPSTWGYSFETLGHLPSVETVRVLGEMLDDMRSLDRLNREPKDWNPDDRPLAPIGHGAAGALTRLGISGAPMKEFARISKEDKMGMTAKEYYDTNIEPWRFWYAQVKSGKRTFRFEGSDVEYNLDGPVGSVAVATRRETEPVPAETAAPERGANFWPLAIALGVLGAAGGWYVVSGRKRQAS